MSKLTLDKLVNRPDTGNDAPNWARVGLDTGGIAAGAKEVLETLHKAKEVKGLAADIRQCGSLGLAFADPVVQVKTASLPIITYGGIDADTATTIVNEHLAKGVLLQDHIIATRERSTHLNGDRQIAILVRDTSEQSGDKTEFFQISLQQELEVHGIKDIPVYRAMDMGIYDQGMCIQLLPSGVTYSNVLTPDLRRIISESLQNNRVVEDLLVSDPDPQMRVVLRNCGTIDPDDIDDYLRHGGYKGLGKLLEKSSPEQGIEEIKLSGLRGRGGAGFPTWLKWKLTRDPVAERKYVICNADEGDPGAFMDRSVLEGDPHCVLEGLIIAGYCMGASQGYFYIRAEYPLAVKRVRLAIEEARKKGLLGKNILGTGFSFDADVRLGAGAFVCGEETALIASIEGKRGSPTPRPPFPSVKGLFGMPTAINNVETLASVSAILAKGGEWYAQYGTEKSRGTKVFAVTGKVRYAQLVEVPMGIPIRKIIFDICGGVLDNIDLKAVQTGGPSGGVIPEKLLDTSISYESLSELGSIMGSGGMLVMDENDSMVDVAKFYLKFCVDESCGKCAPCRIGGYQLLQLLEKIFRGKGEESDIEQMRRICHTMQTASLCGLGQTAPNPVLSTLRYFKEEYSSFIEGGASYARKVKKQLSDMAKMNT
jgi:NADP-reducing hydrogenase subunit HndC